ICFSTTSVGELKKTMDSLSAPSTKATARAITPSAAPMRERRRCLRVMARLRLAFEAKSFEEIVEPPQFAGVARERTARMDDGGARLVGLAEHHIGANESQPSLHIAAVAMQPLGKPLDHALNHGLALLGSELRRRSHLFGAWTCTRSSPWIVGRGRTVDAGQRASQQIDPW